MKYIVSLIAAMTILSGTIAQKAIDVPDAVIAAFAKEFPGITNPTWDKEDGKFEADFNLHGKATSALFSSAGKLVETEVVISINELPAKALQFASAIGKIKEASRITKEDGTVLFEAEVNKKDLLFDSNGNPIKD